MRGGHSHGGNGMAGQMHAGRQKMANRLFPVHCCIFLSTFVVVHKILLPTDFYTGISTELLIFDVLYALMFVSFMRGAFSSPGYVADNWIEKSPQAMKILQNNPALKLNPNFARMMRCPRSARCFEKSKEVLRMDHFCMHYNNAVGLYNYKFFVLSLIYVWLTAFYVVYLIVSKALDPDQSFGGFLNGLIIFVWFLLGVLLVAFSSYTFYFHSRNIIRNLTSIEFAKMSGRIFQAKEMGIELELIHPWDYGPWDNTKRMIGTDWWFWLCPTAPALKEDGYDFPPNPEKSKEFTAQQQDFQMQVARAQRARMNMARSGLPGAAIGGGTTASQPANGVALNVKESEKEKMLP